MRENTTAGRRYDASEAAIDVLRYGAAVVMARGNEPVG